MKCRNYEQENLERDLELARNQLMAFRKAINAPVGSFQWEAAIHSGDTIESLEESVRRAEEAYYNSMK